MTSTILHEHWSGAAPTELMGRLMPAAVHALHEEDRRLVSAFARSPSIDPRVNRGLAYWVFETTLVYEIFKAWLPIVEAQWEVPYPAKASDKADLVVKVGGRVEIVVEAKWWQSETRQVGEYLRADIAKLLRWPDAERYLLTFWISSNASRAWSDDLASVDRFCAALGDARVALRYAAAFSTDHHATRAGEGSYFAVAFLSVEPASPPGHALNVG